MIHFFFFYSTNQKSLLKPKKKKKYFFMNGERLLRKTFQSGDMYFSTELANETPITQTMMDSGFSRMGGKKKRIEMWMIRFIIIL